MPLPYPLGRTGRALPVPRSVWRRGWAAMARWLGQDTVEGFRGTGAKNSGKLNITRFSCWDRNLFPLRLARAYVGRDEAEACG